ncbi:MAG: 4-(cytidine 5'-diphospho)-2-C-methyl-D-erythritol kinase [Campylobacteraceae bacterium]|jgi:4-diphosphocytidyl-2-C-methyl-D-erythritol kinase|nr:4-(cytidine 5'-diphospho)-2-C-methyl-D-erythritol kinase [Campylobacteraceae bacterium]
MLSFKSYAKVNVFLKVVGKRGTYHEIKSRFLRIESLYDMLVFKPKTPKKGLEFFGDFGCGVHNNTIYKAHRFLKEYTKSSLIDDFFEHHALYVEKNIPRGGGLGGGSSNAAVLILALNKILGLNLDIKEMCTIGNKVGADVNFFLHECEAADVEGAGEIVMPIKDDIPKIELVITNKACDTARVYRVFRESFWNSVDTNLAYKMAGLSSKELLDSFAPIELNDLLRSVLVCYPILKVFTRERIFLSGSGGTFFKVLNGYNNSKK